jgi:cholesterol transport system auxiliary component
MTILNFITRARLRSARLCLLPALVLALSGCALFSKSEPMEIRYFSPEIAPRGAAAAPDASAPRIRLGRVRAGEHLEERMAFRSSEEEIAFHEGLRWTERPEEYVRRALASALYEQRGFTQAISGAAPTVDVELLAFEEVRGERPVARIEARVVLHDGRNVRFEQTLRVEEPREKEDSPSAGARAASRALQLWVERVAAQIETVVRALPAPGEERATTASGSTWSSPQP